MLPDNLSIAPASSSHPTEGSKHFLPWLVAVAFFMESLDTTILNTAVPTISAALHVGALSMKAVLASYTLSLAVFIPISGWMADRFGTRRVFACAIGLFTLGSFLCGLSGNIHWLIVCRILQGCGGAMMVPAGLATAIFVPATGSSPAEMTLGIHRALIGLGALTIASTIVFRSLKGGDGDDVSQHKALHLGG
ncbi:MAG TPA: MFS transporter [Steroidobacteraceae bacterium]